MLLRQTVLTTVVLVLLAVGVFVLASLVFYPYLEDAGLSNLNSNVYTFLAPVSTVFLLGLLYAWLVRLGARAAVHRSVSFKSFLQFLSVPFRNMLSSLRSVSLSDSAGTRIEEIGRAHV